MAHLGSIYQYDTQHNGREMALENKRLRVDGWDSPNRTASQFHGCRFRGHPYCPVTRDEEFHPKSDTRLAKLYVATPKNRTYLEEECHVQVVEMWECEW